MSMTKRYLESLPQAEQDAILGGVDNAYISPDEWVNDAENEPTEEESAEWARALMEEDDEEPNDPLVKCRICRKTWPISAMNTNGECPDCQLEEWERRENAPMVKDDGPCVTLTAHDGIQWDV